MDEADKINTATPKNYKNRKMFPIAIDKRSMQIVLLALTPVCTAHFAIFGLGVLFNLLSASIAAVGIEALCLYMRGKNVSLYVSDYSALVTAWLIALSLPPYVSWAVTLTAVTIAITLGKHAYGGLGNNLFNPAMIGYTSSLLAYPLATTLWPGPEILDNRFSLAYTWDFFARAPIQHEQALSALSGATAITSLRHAPIDPSLSWENLLATRRAIEWSPIALATLAGGVLLLYLKVIRFLIPVCVLLSFSLMSVIFGNDVLETLRLHWSNGALLICAFFIATDPATSPRTQSGKCLYAAGIGILIYWIRYRGSYIDGVAFAVLIMNSFCVLLDLFFNNKITVPKSQATTSDMKE